MADLASDDEGIAGVLAVVADCGSHSCRAGMSGDENPRVNFASVVGSAKDAKDGGGRVVRVSRAFLHSPLDALRSLCRLCDTRDAPRLLERFGWRQAAA